MPKQALTVGVGTVMDARYELLIFMLLHKNAREVMVLITGANKSIALYKAIEEGVCHMWTVSAFQMHNNTLMVCDEDATLELRVRTVKYFKVGNEKCANMCVCHVSRFHNVLGYVECSRKPQRGDF